MLPVRLIRTGAEPPHRSRANRETHSVIGRQTRGTRGEPNLRGRSEPHPPARHPPCLEDGCTQGLRSGAWLPRTSGCGGNGEERKGYQERTPYPFALWKEQEAFCRAIGGCGHRCVRHSGCGFTILHLYQHHALCDGGLCREQQAHDCYRPSQPLRFRGRTYP